MSVICGIGTYHLIDTSAPCPLIGVELSSVRLPGCFLSLTVREKRPMQSKVAAGGTEGQSKRSGVGNIGHFLMQVNRIFLRINVTIPLTNN